MVAILGVDVGGTFTDFLFWEDGRLALHKRPSTPAELAIFNAFFAAVAEEMGLTLETPGGGGWGRA